MNDWNSVKDRLPEYEDVYIAFYWFFPEAEWRPWVGEVYYKDTKWYRNEQECVVSHWMPLPAPPEQP